MEEFEVVRKNDHDERTSKMLCYQWVFGDSWNDFLEDEGHFDGSIEGHSEVLGDCVRNKDVALYLIKIMGQNRWVHVGRIDKDTSKAISKIDVRDVIRHPVKSLPEEYDFDKVRFFRPESEEAKQLILP